MKFQIKNYVSGSVQAEVEIETRFESESFSVQLGAAVKVAYKTGAYLTDAYLTGADLTGADLTGANLRGAYLTGADLTGAYLTGADLTGADLTGAYLKGADLRGAYLTGAYLKGADLRGADLTGAYGEPIKHATPEESVATLDKVREIILDNEAALNMGHWHDENSKWEDKTCAEEAVCGTSHCLAGWLQVCSTDKNVRALDPQLAGIVMAPVAAKMFFRKNDETLAWLKGRKYAEEAKEYT